MCLLHVLCNQSELLKHLLPEYVRVKRGKVREGDIKEENREKTTEKKGKRNKIMIVFRVCHFSWVSCRISMHCGAHLG